MKKGILRQVLKGIGNGIIDSVPILSSIKLNIAHPHLANEEEPMKGMGRIDYIRLMTTLTISGLILAFVVGKISKEDLEYLMNFLKK